jgi:hypothetical protein
MIQVEVTDPAELEALMSATDYVAYLKEQAG